MLSKHLNVSMNYNSTGEIPNVYQYLLYFFCLQVLLLELKEPAEGMSLDAWMDPNALTKPINAME